MLIANTFAYKDNDTLSHIGCECLDQYIQSNVEKFDENCWNLVTQTLKMLFEETTAYGLFDDTQDLVDVVKKLSLGGKKKKEQKMSLVYAYYMHSTKRRKP